MGGRIVVAVRFEDGQTVVQNRWTNPLSSYLRDIRIFQGDRAYIDRMLEENEYRTKNVLLAPVEYGLIVLDYKTKHILSLNSYFDIDQCDPAHFVFNDFEKFEEGRSIDLLVREGRFSETDAVFRTPRKPLPADVTDILSFKARAKVLNTANSKFNGPYTAFAIDTTPMIYEKFPESLRGCIQFQETLRHLGFNLTDADHAAWAAYERKWAVR